MAWQPGITAQGAVAERPTRSFRDRLGEGGKGEGEGVGIEKWELLRFLRVQQMAAGCWKSPLPPAR